MRVLCIFLDGVGIGSDNRTINPFASIPTRIFSTSAHQFRSVIFDGIVIPTDACLGVPGLPQSATGQTALFSGVNTAQQLGMHLSGFATQPLIAILRQESIFVKVLQQGKTAAFANAYSQEFFLLPDKIRSRITSVTTAATLTAGLPFLLADDILSGRSLYHDFTNMALRQRGYNIPIFSPDFAGRQLALLSQEYDFCLYEYFLTDHVGHLGDFALAISEIKKIETFLTAILEHTDLRSTVVILCSDHGNMEDMSVNVHTMNLVPTIVWGDVPRELITSIQCLTDVTPFILRCLDIQDPR
jgi:2,3-bisphosphoglycerate-independent phosphoglycerate mutase